MSAPAAFGLLALVFVISAFVARVPLPRYVHNVLTSASVKKVHPMAAFADVVFGLFAASIAFGATELLGRLLHVPIQWHWLIATGVWLSLAVSWWSIRNAIVASIEKVTAATKSVDGN